MSGWIQSITRDMDEEDRQETTAHTEQQVSVAVQRVIARRLLGYLSRARAEAAASGDGSDGE